MTLSFTRFGDIDLPEYNPVTQAGTRPALTGLVRTTDGRFFDRLGDKQAFQAGGELAMSATYHTDHAHLSELKYNDLLSMQGKAAWLYRKQWGTDYTTRIWARLDQVIYTSRVFNLQTYFDVSCRFFVQDYAWNGHKYGTWEPAGGKMKSVNEDTIPGLSDSLPVTFTASGGESSTTMDIETVGNVAVRGFLIEIIGATSNLTGITITDGANYDIDYTAAIGSTDTIRIDTLGKTVTDQDSTGVFASFALGGNHTRTDWLLAENGKTTFTVSPYSGTFPASVAVKIHYADAWQ